MERYEVIKYIGSGNFGVAKLVRDIWTKELYTVKFIKRGEKVEHVQREIMNHRSLRHPNIVRIKEIATELLCVTNSSLLLPSRKRMNEKPSTGFIFVECKSLSKFRKYWWSLSGFFEGGCAAIVDSRTSLITGPMENIKVKSEFQTVQTAEELELAFSPRKEFGFNATMEILKPET